MGRVRVSPLGSSQPVTKVDSEAGNQPVGNWMPGIYDRCIITDAGQKQLGEVKSWAELAALARSDWDAENPF